VPLPDHSAAVLVLCGLLLLLINQSAAGCCTQSSRACTSVSSCSCRGRLKAAGSSSCSSSDGSSSADHTHSSDGGSCAGEVLLHQRLQYDPTRVSLEIQTGGTRMHAWVRMYSSMRSHRSSAYQPV
jgi:hypothetical protein